MTVLSTKITRDRKLTAAFSHLLGANKVSLKQNYFAIYFENSSKKRLMFFSEPLIQHLWTFYLN